jgi:hypothetical protein
MTWWSSSLGITALCPYLSLDLAAAAMLSAVHGNSPTRQPVHRPTASRPQSEGTDRDSRSPVQPNGRCPFPRPSGSNRQATGQWQAVRRHQSQNGCRAESALGQAEEIACLTLRHDVPATLIAAFCGKAAGGDVAVPATPWGQRRGMTPRTCRPAGASPAPRHRHRVPL